MGIKGRIHSFETCGTVDGPGIRFVIFMQGCPLRCKYCHNPDTWKIDDGNSVESSYIVNEIKKYRSYMKFSGGGVTITGGEPLMQPEFVLEIIRSCKKEGIHTVVDTSGFSNIDVVKSVLGEADLVLLDIKCIDKEIHKQLTGVELEPVLKTAEYLAEIGKKVWIRHVLVPGITDSDEQLRRLAEYISNLKNVEKVEILPFHKMGEYKWESMGYKYELKDTPAPTNERVENAIKIMGERGIKAV